MISAKNLLKSSILTLALLVGAAHADTVTINTGDSGSGAPVETAPPAPAEVAPELPKTTVTLEKTGGCEASTPGRGGDVGGLASMMMILFPLLVARRAALRARQS